MGNFIYKFLPPPANISDFVESIGMFHNQSEEVKEVVVMPDGRVDLFFVRSSTKGFQIMLIGLETEPEQRSIPPHTLSFVISFKPLAVEYILHTSIADILNTAKVCPADFWSFSSEDLNDFEAFFIKISKKVEELLPALIDKRKKKLFELIYASRGEMSVTELSEKLAWSSRQINRYFSQQFGLPLKAYCTILRFRYSLEHIAKGKIVPELNFTDQTHFIKEIKKFSGVVPKELSKNQKDRFILLSVLKQK